MMLNKMPANTSLQAILSYLDTANKFGARDRALFALRQQLRIKDISGLLVSDLVNPDMTIRRFFISRDGIRSELGDEVQAEVRRYLIARFVTEGDVLEPLLAIDRDIPLFPTQKRCQFSPNTLAQHFSYLDKQIHQRFQAAGRSRTTQSQSVSSVLQAPVKVALMRRLMSSFTGA